MQHNSVFKITSKFVCNELDFYLPEIPAYYCLSCKTLDILLNKAHLCVYVLYIYVTNMFVYVSNMFLNIQVTKHS